MGDTNEERINSMTSVLASVEATPNLSLLAERRGGSAGTYRVPREYASQAQIDEVYRKDRLAARIVEMLPHDATRRGWDVDVQVLGQESDDEDTTETLQTASAEAEAYLRSIKAREKIREAASVARLKSESILVIGADDGGDDVARFEEPLENPSTINWLRVYGKEQFTRGPVDEDPASENFGEPQNYRVQTGATRLTFHASRVVHIYGHKVPGEDTYQSVLQSIGRELDDYRQAHSSAAKCVEDFSRVAYGMHGLAAAARRKDGATEVVARLRTMEDGLRLLGVYLYDKDNESVDYQTRGVNGLEGLLKTFGMRICAITGTSMTRLLGDSPGGLGTGDHETNNWDDDVQAYQTDEIVPAATKICRVVWLAKDGPTGGKEPEKWEVKARPLRQPKPKEEAELRETLARFAALLVENSIISREEAAESLFGRGELGFDIRLDKEARKRQDTEVEPSPELDAELAATRGVPDTGNENIQAQALNGAQIQSFLELVDAVATGAMPKATAVRFLPIAFPAQLDASLAAALLEPVEEKEKRESPVPPPFPPPGGAAAPPVPPVPPAPPQSPDAP